MRIGDHDGLPICKIIYTYSRGLFTDHYKEVSVVSER
jgi:hypothetical protein